MSKINQELNLPKTIEELTSRIDSEYKDMVMDFYNKKLNKKIYNSNLYHALFLTNLLINEAKSSVKIFSGTLPEAVFRNEIIKNTIKDKISKNQNLQFTIIVERYDKTPECLLDKHIEVRKLIDKVDVVNHLVIIDNNAYRIENEHELGSIDKVEAIVNFNDAKNAGFLDKLFTDRILPYSEVVKQSP